MLFHIRKKTPKLKVFDFTAKPAVLLVKPGPEPIHVHIGSTHCLRKVCERRPDHCVERVNTKHPMSHESASKEECSSFKSHAWPEQMALSQFKLTPCSDANLQLEHCISWRKNNMGSEGKEKKNIRKLFSRDLPGMKKSVGQGQSRAGNLLASMCFGNNHLQKLCHSVAGESSL